MCMDLQRFFPVSMLCSNKFTHTEHSCSYRTEKIFVEVNKSDGYNIKIAISSHLLPAKKLSCMHEFIRDYIGIANASASASEYRGTCSDVSMHQLDKLHRCISVIDRLPPLVMRNIDLSDILMSESYSFDIPKRYKESYNRHIVSDI
jgi:hypothetical protein